MSGGASHFVLWITLGLREIIVPYVQDVREHILCSTKHAEKWHHCTAAEAELH